MEGKSKMHVDCGGGLWMAGGGGDDEDDDSDGNGTRQEIGVICDVLSFVYQAKTDIT